jgi:iron-sulfur cluster assembly protein
MSDCGDVQKAFVPIKKEDVKKVVKPISSLEITDIAAERIKHFSNMDDKNSSTHGLKVGVVNDGCSGKSYTMDLAEIEPSLKNGDKLFEKNGATVIVEKLSYMFVMGSVLDYQESLLASGFQLTNPNVKGSCSCGSSFKV